MKKSIKNAIIALFVAAVLTVGICCAGFSSRNEAGKWFRNWNLATWHWADKSVGNDDSDGSGGFGGPAFGEGENDGIEILSALLPRSAYAVNGVAESVDSAYMLTAKVNPEYASDKTLDWHFAWTNGESEWASGKTVTDYVTVTPTSDGALTALAVCLQPFGEQVTVEVSLRSVVRVKGTATVDYEQKFFGLSSVLTFGGQQEVNFSTSLEGGTITATLPTVSYYPGYPHLGWIVHICELKRATCILYRLIKKYLFLMI